MTTPLPNISVIIPTYRDWRGLRGCLDALKSQTYSPDLYEIVVINNDPADQLPQNLLSNNVHFLWEAKKGSYAARNTGIKVARGGILAFTDSDCIPDRRWIENIAREFGEGAERIAGKISLTYRSHSLSLAETYEKAFAFDQEHNSAMGISVTANMAVKASLFSQFGLFDEGTESGGDIEWSSRVTMAKVPIKYVETIIVQHPARYKISDIIKKKNRVLRGKKKIAHTTYERNILKTLTLAFFPPLNTAFRLSRKNSVTPIEFTKAISIQYAMKIYSAFYIAFLKLFDDRAE